MCLCSPVNSKNVFAFRASVDNVLCAVDAEDDEGKATEEEEHNNEEDICKSAALVS